MSISPLDMQVMVPRLQEVSRISHLDQQKGQVQQDSIAMTNQQHNRKEAQTVVDSKADEKAKNQQDAKDEGSNAYYEDPRYKKKQDRDPKNEEEDNLLPRHKIDVKI